VAGQLHIRIDRRVLLVVLVSLIAATLVLVAAAPADAAPRDAGTSLFCRRADARVNPQNSGATTEPNPQAADALAHGYITDLGQAHRTCGHLRSTHGRHHHDAVTAPQVVHRPRPVAI
jgi:hypothetical protein